MPATPTRIAFVKEEYRSLTIADTDIRDRYGKVARDTGDAPVETFFESMSDVNEKLGERHDLLSADRRRFDVRVAEILDFGGALAFNVATPTVLVTDDEKGVSARPCIMTQIEAIDYETQTTRLGIWG